MKYLLICLLPLFCCTQCQEPSKPIPTADTASVAAPVITAITADGVVQLADGTRQPIPHYGDPAYLILYLVRHCEKEPQPDNPPLSAMGQARAERLGRILDNAVIDKLCSTNTRRTVQTAEALKFWTGDPVIETFPVEAQSDWLAENLNNPGARRLLYVGHSNTVPVLLNELTRSLQYKNIPETEFDHFYVAVTKGLGQTEVLSFRY